MFQCERILFPIEFSRRDEAAAPFVLSMARRYQSRIILLHVLQPAPPTYAGMGVLYPETFDYGSLRDDLLVQVRRFAADQLPKVDTECVVELGDPASMIAQTACSRDIHLIAMPTHGYGAFRRALLGSVTAKVLHDSLLPVWTSAHVPEPSHHAHPQPRRVICAVDMGPEGRHTVEVAIALANDVGAALELVHVPAETVAPEAAEQHLQDLLREVAGTEAIEVVETIPAAAELAVAGGGVADGVRDIALRKRADLVVIGRGAIHKGLGSLRGHSYDIIRECPCPVVSV
jgi:nucleotide-binding universal stress UspA family protein